MLKSNSLVAAYNFERDARDWSGNGNNGTVNGATLVKGLRGNAYSFITNDYIDLGSTGTIANLGSVLTFSFWIYPRDITTNQIIFYTSNSTVDGLLYIQLFSGNLRFLIYDGGSIYHDITAPTINKYTHVAITYDKNLASDNLKCYYNAVNVGTFNMTATLNDTNRKTKIGRSSIIGNYYLNAILDSFEVYLKALPLTDIQRLNRGLKPLNA